MTMRVAVYTLLFWMTLAAWAGPTFERAEAAAELGGQLSNALERKDAPAVMRLFTDEPIRFFTQDETAEGRAEIEKALEPLMRDRANFPFERTAPRVWAGYRECWLLFPWTWGAREGTLIARLTDEAESGWRVADLDLYGETAKKPPLPRFDSRAASKTLEGPAKLISEAGDAIQDGNLANIIHLLAPEYEFIDENGNRFEGQPALLAAAQTILPGEVTVERSRLYVSPDARRAVAFQNVGLRRLSLLLVQNRDGWKLAGASMSVPYETLNVEDSRPLSLTWAALKRG